MSLIRTTEVRFLTSHQLTPKILKIMTGKEFEALPYVPKEIQVKCNDYLHQIASYKETDFTENGYRLVVEKGVVGILVRIKSEHSLRFCPMNKIL